MEKPSNKSGVKKKEDDVQTAQEIKINLDQLAPPSHGNGNKESPSSRSSGRKRTMTDADDV